MTYIGIDPGKNGAIAVLPAGDYAKAFTHSMPETELDLVELLRDIAANNPSPVAVLEQVAASPQMGVVSAFSFGRNFGSILTALVAARIPFSTVTPAKWQGTLGCRTKGDKNITKAKAQALFSHLKITHGNADALLLSEYCRRLSTQPL